MLPGKYPDEDRVCLDSKPNLFPDLLSLGWATIFPVEPSGAGAKAIEVTNELKPDGVILR